MAQVNKKEQILETAGKLFMEEGFRKVSMEAIASAVPVSKPTLYNNFTDKKQLFEAVISTRCKEFITIVEESIHDERDVAEVLKSIGSKFLAMIISPEAIKINRIITSECEEFPEIAALFYNSGPKKALTFLMTYLESQKIKGTLKVADTRLSANMFLSMLKGHWHMQCVLGLYDSISAGEQKNIVNYAVEIFLKGHTK